MDGIEFTWSEAKRLANILKHRLDFIDAAHVFSGPTVTSEDKRFAYPEPRYVTLGLFEGIPVAIVHTESTHEIRIISFREATHAEAEAFFENLPD